MIYFVKPEEEISLKRRQSLPMIQPHGINISVLETRQITQLSSQRISKIYVSDNLETNKGNLLKTWNLINDLTARHSGKTSNILQIKADNKIVSNPVDIAEIINEHFTNIT